MKLKFLQAIDWILVLCIVCLVTVGILFIYSSGFNSDGVNVSKEYIKQIVWGSIGLVLMLSVAFIDYRKLYNYANYLFLLMFLLLVYTKLFGRYVKGARSWIGFGGFGIQPSEFCKILFIIFLARYYERYKNKSDRVKFITSIFIFFVPIGLILIQPDLGTASVYFPIFITMAFIAGIPLRYIMFLCLCSVFTVLFTVLPIWETSIAQKSYPIISILTNLKLRLVVIFTMAIVGVIGFFGKIFYKQIKYFYWISYSFGIGCLSLIFSFFAGFELKEYQIQRLIIFLKPEIDRQGAGWNIIQSKIAIGSGSTFGQGFLRGTQSHYRFLPEQSTDFIFSILAEELGFIGCMAIFAVYMLLLFRIISILRHTKIPFGSYIVAGILGMFFYHFWVNVGMVMGMMPITGIPLLFLSYGGSSLWTAMICVGLLMSVRYRKYDF